MQYVYAVRLQRQTEPQRRGDVRGNGIKYNVRKRNEIDKAFACPYPVQYALHNIRVSIIGMSWRSFDDRTFVRCAQCGSMECSPNEAVSAENDSQSQNEHDAAVDEPALLPTVQRSRPSAPS